MTISIEFSDEGQYDLMVSSPGMSAMPAGARLFRAPPHPQIKFNHDTLPEAERDAALLRAYLAGLPVRGQTKRELREAGA